ncbi:MAG TPA: fatty acid--CoA ligase family protein [Candidatus Sulfotelmatobacter sp.]|nr:fatty acid--CoA ligase family protein [Candidatus Sulfotelmatobacter sp.]
MPSGDGGSLWQALSAAGDLRDRHLRGATASVRLEQLIGGTSLDAGREALRGRSVLLATRDQLAAALALIELDGVARRIVLLPTGVPPAHVATLMTAAAIDAVVADSDVPDPALPAVDCFVTCRMAIAPAAIARDDAHPTEWILLTSGTTGVPKLVRHSLTSLAGPTRAGGGLGRAAVWSTFYDIRRYGGLQMFFRALLGGGSLVLSNPAEGTADFLARAGAFAVTHISGTPSHWRRALMSPALRQLKPRYVRLSGEIADQAILDQLRAFFPEASVAHAFASTEAGVGFEVDDGRAGFPAGIVGRIGEAVEIRITGGSLRLRSSRTSYGYLGGEALADAEGFVDTGDMVERRGERYYFIGRRDGMINVGGLKVHPEEVEAVINSHPEVQMALVKARRSPITGALVAAEVVLTAAPGADAPRRAESVREALLESCRRALPPYKVPAGIRFVDALDVAASGKLNRGDA